MFSDDDNEPEEQEFPDCQTDIHTNACVLEYAQDIIHAANLQNKDIDVAIDFDIAVNSTSTLSAAKAKIESALGAIMVFPNFKTQSSTAYILNRGVINRMLKEGFTEEFVQRNGNIYSDEFEFTQKNVKLLGYYLTHKLNNDTQSKTS